MDKSISRCSATGRIFAWNKKLELLDCRCDNSVLLIFAGDNGVSCEHIGSCQPMESVSIVRDHLEGRAATTRLLKQLGLSELIIDVGLARPIDDTRIVDYNVCRGSKNFLYEDALQELEVLSALQAGARLWDEISGTNFDIILVGEIGISDTLCAAAVASAVTGLPPVQLTGKGSANSKVIEKKVDIISRAMMLRRPEPGNVTDILMRFGGLEIAALTGFLLRIREHRVPVMLDGYVTAVAALLAGYIDPSIKEYLLAPSLSGQTGHGLILERLGLDFLFDMDINYGEGLAAVLGLYLVRLLNAAFCLT